MRILQLSSLVLVPGHLFLLCLPIAALSTSNLNTGLQAKANHGVAESSNTIAKPESWASFLNPSHIIESIKGALFPPDHGATVSLQPEALATSGSDASPPDFWDTAKKYEHILQDYVPQLLNSAATFFDSTKFTDIMSAMHGIVNATATFHESMQGTLHARGITLDMLTQELEGVFMAVAKDLESIPPPDKAPGHAERVQMLDKILDDVATGLANLSPRLGIEEEVATNYIRAVKPHIHALVVAVGDINEQYPDLFPALAFSVVVLLLPQEWILRPFLSLLGFGPEGPVKGSAATWLQSYFWGAAVESGSWFAWLQAAGMGAFPKWADVIAKVPLLVSGLLAMLFPAKQD